MKWIERISFAALLLIIAFGIRTAKLQSNKNNKKIETMLLELKEIQNIQKEIKESLDHFETQKRAKSVIRSF